MTISLCMIVKDEEKTLARCLESVKDLVDEIIIVDTGSVDRTKEIAAKYTEKIYDFHWIDDFSAARNASFDYASMEYCMWLDGDDLLLEEDRIKFRKMKASVPKETDVVMLPYQVAFDAQGKATFVYQRERIVRRGSDWRWEGPVHEAIVPNGSIFYGEAAVTHRKEGLGDPDRNLRIYQACIQKGRPFSPRDAFYYARELYFHQYYEKALEEFTKFLERPDGWIENKVEACRQMSVCWKNLGKTEKAREALTRSLAFSLPRAEVCCDLGQLWMEEQDWEKGAFWYEQALKCQPQTHGWGFVLPDCYDYLPNLQLCVCWDRMGDHQKAREYNRRAGQIKPNDPAVLYNERYFATLHME